MIQVLIVIQNFNLKYKNEITNYIFSFVEKKIVNLQETRLTTERKK